MGFPKSQAIVDAACKQVQSVILDQMMLEREKRLCQHQDSYQTEKTQREAARQKLNMLKKPKKPTVTVLRHELKDLQFKYA